jgi:hypothetical protein
VLSKNGEAEGTLKEFCYFPQQRWDIGTDMDDDDDGDDDV